ncbi:MAG: HD domain-containing phosphohydrolase [Acidobacteriota bacterium]
MGTYQGPNWTARAFSWVVIALGISILIAGISNWQTLGSARGYLYLLIALTATGVRVRLPHKMGPISINFVFVLLGVLDLPLSQTLLIGASTVLVQGYIYRFDRNKNTAPLLYHLAATSVAISITYKVYFSSWLSNQDLHSVYRLIVASGVLYSMNTFAMSAWAALSDRGNLALAWRELNVWAFPYYVAGACLAGLFHFSQLVLGGQSPVLLLPFAFIAHCVSHSYLGRLSNQKHHLERMAELHMRTIEALALAIEAKDHTAQNHLQRMQLYCHSIGKVLNLPTEELEALRAAAVLHDVGKLAVPEHILAKPGRLTREEFEKVKIHPSIGAEILERVDFPYPVARIVRYHHEKWNGGGYPSGLRGEEIPVGARILAAVDCFDALISGRPYRSAYSIDEALGKMADESGSSFDPRVIDVLLEGYLEWEEMLAARAIVPVAQERDVATELMQRDQERMPPRRLSSQEIRPAYFDTIAAARQEAQVLLELTQQLGNSLHLDETLSVLAGGLKQMIAFDSITIYVLRDEILSPRYASGDCASILLSREIPFGQGLVGWVAQHRNPIVNGNPRVELGAAAEGVRAAQLESALALPLIGLEETAGVLMLSRRNAESFSKDNLRVLLTITGKLGVVVENALKYEQATASASTDFLTALPNSRSLFLQLESEIARASRTNGTLAVLVTDLDGFKLVNDRHGHLVGNAVLRSVAKTLRLSCREYDYVARMGGDEFVILMPGMKPGDLNDKVVALDHGVTAAAYTVCPEAEIALSVGIAQFPADGPTAEQLLAEADHRMYQSKQQRKRLRRRAAAVGFDFERPTQTGGVAGLKL